MCDTATCHSPPYPTRIYFFHFFVCFLKCVWTGEGRATVARVKKWSYAYICACSYTYVHVGICAVHSPAFSTCHSPPYATRIYFFNFFCVLFGMRVHGGRESGGGARVEAIVFVCAWIHTCVYMHRALLACILALSLSSLPTRIYFFIFFVFFLNACGERRGSEGGGGARVELSVWASIFVYVYIRTCACMYRTSDRILVLSISSLPHTNLFFSFYHLFFLKFAWTGEGRVVDVSV